MASKPPAFASASSEDLLTGGHLLRQAFRDAPLRSANRGAIIINAEDREPPVLQIHRGVAYSSHAFPDGRRAIIDLMLPSDIVGIEHSVLGRSNYDVIAASALGYRRMPAQTLRQLMADPRVAVRVLALMAEAKWRVDRHVAAIARMDARARVAAFLLGIYDRLRRSELIGRPTFNLYLTQDQIGDHLGITPVHTSRTLRRLNEERLAIVDHGIAIIHDVERLRAFVARLPASPMVQHEMGQLEQNAPT